MAKNFIFATGLATVFLTVILSQTTAYRPEPPVVVGYNGTGVGECQCCVTWKHNEPRPDFVPTTGEGKPMFQPQYAQSCIPAIAEHSPSSDSNPVAVGFEGANMDTANCYCCVKWGHTESKPAFVPSSGDGAPQWQPRSYLSCVTVPPLKNRA